MGVQTFRFQEWLNAFTLLYAWGFYLLGKDALGVRGSKQAKLGPIPKFCILNIKKRQTCWTTVRFFLSYHQSNVDIQLLCCTSSLVCGRTRFWWAARKDMLSFFQRMRCGIRDGRIALWKWGTRLSLVGIPTCGRQGKHRVTATALCHQWMVTRNTKRWRESVIWISRQGSHITCCNCSTWQYTGLAIFQNTAWLVR